ncbi:MAG: hypothetical protein HYX39_12340 [Bacteroidetes bacterium]|nr:hypothetical protein [Bacteroidota bacterium]
MKFLFITLTLILFSCQGYPDKTLQRREDSLMESTNLKIKILKERGDSVEKANVKRTGDH